MRHVHRVVIIVALIGPVTISVACAEQEKSVNSGALNASIRKLAPGAAVVVTQEVDAISCNPVGDNPGLVRADFNGDGRPDYAALLKIRETGKKTIWEGKTLREASFSFVLFLDDGHGGYEPRVVRRYTDFIPTGVVLDLQPPGSVLNGETQKSITLSNPGVTLSFCEKSAVTYYVAGGKIHSIPIADY